MNTPAKLFGYVFGAVYVLVGLVGFAVTGFDGFAAPEGDMLLFFEVNPLHNLVHIAIGGLLLAAAGAGERAARQAAIVVGAAYALVGVLGIAIPQDAEINILALNAADHALHLGTAALAFAAAWLSSQRDPAGRAGETRGRETTGTR